MVWLLPQTAAAAAHLARPPAAQGDEEEETPPPPYVYEGPRAEGESVEISVTIEPEDPEAEGAAPKTRTKTITLLGPRKGEKGKATYPNLDVYEGGYFDGLRHASGSYTYASQPPPAEGEDPPPPMAKYEGGWKKGQKSGLGVMVYSGDQPLPKYHGMWKNGKRDGQGSFFYANGDIYSGEWKDGKKHGEGTYFCKATETKLVGTYVKGELTYGTFSDKFGAAFTGSFANGDYGEGAWRLASGAAA